MRVVIESIPHARQRYESPGDWKIEQCPDGSTSITIKVSELGDWKQELLIGVHELVEASLCLEAGITGEVIDQFDMEFERNRQPGNNYEPGDEPTSPYRRQHRFAEVIERLLATELKVDWAVYGEKVNALHQ